MSKSSKRNNKLISDCTIVSFIINKVRIFHYVYYQHLNTVIKKPQALLFKESKCNIPQIMSEDSAYKRKIQILVSKFKFKKMEE